MLRVSDAIRMLSLGRFGQGWPCRSKIGLRGSFTLGQEPAVASECKLSSVAYESYVSRGGARDANQAAGAGDGSGKHMTH
jgi:hypothetical protein